MYKALKKLFNSIVEFVIEEYKFLISLALIYIICTWPVNYYIIVGGGISDVSERVSIEEGYESEGSFNLSYVSELKGTTISYLLSYVIPSWDRENMDDYKYTETESYEDIEFRGDMDLKSTNGNAIKVAYTLAGKKCEEISSKIYIIATFDEYETELLVQDQLIGINDFEFKEVSEFSDYLQQFNKGDVVDIKVVRNGEEKVIKCKVYEEDERKILGVALQIIKEYETDPEVEITFKKSESGPSGGLITTLEIYDKLVKKDITNSLKVAGTGTVDSEGNVGIIGGVKYKIMGADAGGADVFLVPAGENYKEALEVKKEKNLDIEVIEVTTVKEAIEKLSKIKK